MRVSCDLGLYFCLLLVNKGETENPVSSLDDEGTNTVSLASFDKCWYNKRDSGGTGRGKRRTGSGQRWRLAFYGGTSSGSPQVKGGWKADRGRRGGWAGKAALVLSLLALTVSGVALYLLLFGEKEPEYLTYRDQQLLVLEDVDRNQYDPEDFSTDSQGWPRYQSGGRRGCRDRCLLLSGEIDWQAVASSGVGVCHDPGGLPGLFPGRAPAGRAVSGKYGRALAAGLDVGGLFLLPGHLGAGGGGGADFVLSAIRGYPIKYPVVFDWEFIDGAEARTDGMDGETMTQCAAAFCELVSVAGYTPMIYSQSGAGLSVLPAGPAGRLPVLAGGV